MIKLFCMRLLALSVLVLWIGNVSYAQETTKKKDTIFIGRLKIKPSVVQTAEQEPQLKTDLARARDTIEAQMPIVLGRIGIFDLLERERMGELADEGKLKDIGTGTISMLEKTGATYAFFPEIDTFMFGEDQGGAHIDGVGRRNDIRLKMLIRANVRVVEVASGKILPDLIAVQWPKRGDPDYSVLDGEKVDFTVARQQMLVDMSEQLARLVIIQTVGCVRPAKVLVLNEVSGGRQAMLNRGETSDFRKDTVVKFYATQAVEDPDTGEKIVNEVDAGRGVVERTETRKCFVRILEESKDVPVSVGSVAKVEAQPPQSTASTTPVTSSTSPLGQVVLPAPIALSSANEWVDGLAQPSNVKFSIDKLRKSISVVSVKPRLLPTGYLKISTELMSAEETTVTGTYKWFDATQTPIAPGDDRPKTIFLRGRVPTTIDGTAPDTRARSFVLVIEAQGK